MKSLIKKLTISVIYWTFVVMVGVTLRFMGIEFILDVPAGVPLGQLYFASVPGGLLGGLMWGFIEIIDDTYFSKKRKSFGYIVISRTSIYIIIFLIVTFFAAWSGSGSFDFAKRYSLSAISFANFVTFSIASFIFHFFKQMNRKFGPGILLKYLRGMYFNPREEDRIFMFLDLKSSTSIAEKLSHILYSRLIQDCFSELTEPVISNKGQIYQYVGDEVVITWPKADGINNCNCLNVFYDFINRLENRKAYFLDIYGLFPEFKAGLSLGLVTAAEVGELKTEIAFHGDVLNTASRIQGFCNTFNEKLLLSETLAKEFAAAGQFDIQSLGEVELRGKEGSSIIYSCNKL
jgi:adenylate cyclase